MLNLLMCVDSNYLEKACTMLFSLRRYTKEEATVYLMNHSLTDVEIHNFKVYLNQRCKMDFQLVDVRKTFLDDFPVIEAHYKIEMYYRILAQFLLPESLDRILWLDADIVLLKDISLFYHQEFDENKMVVCPDSFNGTPAAQRCNERLKLPEDYVYFNSGVLLMNLKKLRQETSMEEILQKCNQLKENLVYPDQDILNVLYIGQVKYADWKKYNYQVGHTKRLPKQDVSDIVVLHYTSYDKPWDYWKIVNSSKYYWNVRWKQGNWLQVTEAYLRRVLDIMAPCFREIKELLF